MLAVPRVRDTEWMMVQKPIQRNSDIGIYRALAVVLIAAVLIVIVGHYYFVHAEHNALHSLDVFSVIIAAGMGVLGLYALKLLGKVFVQVEEERGANGRMRVRSPARDRRWIAPPANFLDDCFVNHTISLRL